MVANQVFRVYKDEEAMLKVYARRLRMADRKFEKGRIDRERFVSRYDQEVEEDQVTEDGHRVAVTAGIGIIDTMYASMVAVDVEFIVNQIGHGTESQSIVLGRALNQAWKDTKGQRRAKYAIKDSLLTDVGWAKVYYDYVEDIDLQDKPDEALAAEIASLQQENPEITAEEAAKQVPLVQEVAIVLRDRICVDYVPWDAIRYDPSAKRIEDIRWVTQYTRLPVEEVQRNPVWVQYVKDRYGERKGPKKLEDLQGDSYITAGMEEDTQLFKDFDEREATDLDDARVTVCETWDFETGLVTVHPKGIEDLVLHQRVNALMFNLDLEDRNPFKPLSVRDTPSKFEGNGDMRVIHPGLEELDEYRSNQATYISRSIPKVFGPEEAFTQKGKDAFMSPFFGELVGLAAGHSFQEIGTVSPPAMTQEMLQIPERVEAELKDATGASEPMRGVFPSRRTTATESKIVSGAGELRQAERRGNLEDWYIAIARTMMQLMQLFYDQERMMRYTDDVGQEFAWKWTKEDIAMDADLEIHITPKENLTREDRVQRMYQYLNLILPVPETDRISALQKMGREMGFRDEEVRALVKSQQEMQAEKQQAQVQSQLAVAPQAGAQAPPGLSITPK